MQSLTSKFPSKSTTKNIILVQWRRSLQKNTLVTNVTSISAGKALWRSIYPICVRMKRFNVRCVIWGSQAWAIWGNTKEISVGEMNLKSRLRLALLRTAEETNEKGDWHRCWQISTKVVVIVNTKIHIFVWVLAWGLGVFTMSSPGTFSKFPLFEQFNLAIGWGKATKLVFYFGEQ